MGIRLQKADIYDCEKIHQMQVVSFKYLLDKYGDLNTNPGAESAEQITCKMKQDYTDYYFVCCDAEIIGAIRIVKLPGNICRISPMFILPQFQGKGYAQQIITTIEKLYFYAAGWQLDTIKEEPMLCHLYEKMG